MSDRILWLCLGRRILYAVHCVGLKPSCLVPRKWTQNFGSVRLFLWTSYHFWIKTFSVSPACTILPLVMCSLLLYINKWHHMLVLPHVWLQKDAQFRTYTFAALVMSIQLANCARVVYNNSSVTTAGLHYIVPCKTILAIHVSYKVKN
jgi:hypothetical protein